MANIIYWRLQIVVTALMSTINVTITDENGETWEFIQYEDILVPKKVELTGMPALNMTRLVRTIEYQEGDLFLVSYPKTGTHWTCNLAHFIRSKGPVDDIPSVGPILVEMFPAQVTLNALKPRLLTSHLKTDRMPRDHMDRGAKMLFVLRNPKDTAVSMFHMLRKKPAFGSNISWDCFLNCFLQGLVPGGSYFAYLDDWQDAIQENPDKFCIVYYEDLKKNCLPELKRIQKFLGCNNDDERLQQIINKCSLGSLKADVDSGKVKSPLVDNEGKSVLYRKGEIGDWRNQFTVAQNEMCDRVIAKRLKKSMFKFQYE